MPLSTMTIGSGTPAAEQSQEQNVRLAATRQGLRLEMSRRQGDRTCGPTLYWLFDGTTRSLISSKSGWSLDHVRDYLAVGAGHRPGQQPHSGAGRERPGGDSFTIPAQR